MKTMLIAKCEHRGAVKQAPDSYADKVLEHECGHDVIVSVLKPKNQIMKAKHILAASIVLLFATANARLVSEIDKDIVKLRNEATALQKNPIVVWGSKQEKLSPEQKKATSRYNINLAQAKERKNYKSKIVITLNPEYVCSVHKLVYENGRAACPSDCKSISRIGTSNFCNLGSQYDLSFRTWNLLKDKMPEGEAQEKRLKEIEQEIRALRDEKLEAEGKKAKKQRAQDENAAEEKTLRNESLDKKGIDMKAKEKGKDTK